MWRVTTPGNISAIFAPFKNQPSKNKMQPLSLALWLGILAYAKAQPIIETVIRLDAAAAAPPSQAAAEAFAVNHSNPAYFHLSSAAIRINNCIDMCRDNNYACTLQAAHRSSCHPDDYAALVAGDSDRSPTRTYKTCIPATCATFADEAHVRLPGLETPLLLNASMGGNLLNFEGTRVMPCGGCITTEWGRSQLVSDLRALCTHVGNYANATRLLWQLGIPQNWNWNQNPNTRLAMLLQRHQHAQRVLKIASQLQSADFCNILATAFIYM